MLTDEEMTQALIAQISDHLIDRDDYFELDDPSIFLEWAVKNYSNFYDGHVEDDMWVEDFDIDAMFDTWVEESCLSV